MKQENIINLFGEAATPNISVTSPTQVSSTFFSSNPRLQANEENCKDTSIDWNTPFKNRLPASS